MWILIAEAHVSLQCACLHVSVEINQVNIFIEDNLSPYPKTAGPVEPFLAVWTFILCTSSWSGRTNDT